MNASLITDSVTAKLKARYGAPIKIGSSSIFSFGASITCSINYSKLLGGHKFFFGIPRLMTQPSPSIPTTRFGEFCLLICGTAETVLVLPRPLVAEMLSGVGSRRLDVFLENGTYILQTTRHPKLVVTEFLNAFPKAERPPEISTDEDESGLPPREHVKVQHSLIAVGRAEGCSVWVPPNDRNLAYKKESFSTLTIERLPNFGFDENTRRIVQNIDVLWLRGNIISNAFEIESTTSIYSGLLRLNDLVLSQPNNNIQLFIAAALRRKQRVFEQLARPTFRPLAAACRYLEFEEIDSAASRISSLSLRPGAHITGLLSGEPIRLSDYVHFPTDT